MAAITKEGAGSAVLLKANIDIPLRNNSRDCMFVYKLLVCVFKENDKIVKGLNNPFETHTIRKINEYGQFILSQLIKVIVLQALTF